MWLNFNWKCQTVLKFKAVPKQMSWLYSAFRLELLQWIFIFWKEVIWMLFTNYGNMKALFSWGESGVDTRLCTEFWAKRFEDRFRAVDRMGVYPLKWIAWNISFNWCDWCLHLKYFTHSFYWMKANVKWQCQNCNSLKAFVLHDKSFHRFKIGCVNSKKERWLFPLFLSAMSLQRNSRNRTWITSKVVSIFF